MRTRESILQHLQRTEELLKFNRQEFYYKLKPNSKFNSCCYMHSKKRHLVPKALVELFDAGEKLRLLTIELRKELDDALPCILSIGHLTLVHSRKDIAA